jgi:hypothetical protein
MKSSLTIAALVFLLALNRAVALDSPLEIGSRSQLVADRTWVQASERVSCTLHPAQKHPANPLVRADQPWEGWRIEIYDDSARDFPRHAPEN